MKPVINFLKRPEPYWFLIFAVFIVFWQYAQKVIDVSYFNPFFISSPERVVIELGKIMFGRDDTPTIWVPFFRTVGTALTGTAAAVVVGTLGGLVCSNWQWVNRVARPYLIFLNAMPKVALIPIVVLILGSSTQSDAAVAFIVVLFVVFFNAYEGGITVRHEVLENARLYGAGPTARMFKVRFPWVMAWAFATIPNAIAFGLVGTVTAELFTGSSGIGQVLIVGLDTSNSDLTFGIVVMLAATGVILVTGADAIRRKVLHWW